MGEQEQNEKNPMEAAHELLSKIKAENVKAEELVQRQERNRAEEILSGRAQAGQEPVKKDKAQEIKERCNNWLLPTGKQI